MTGQREVHAATSGLVKSVGAVAHQNGEIVYGRIAESGVETVVEMLRSNVVHGAGIVNSSQGQGRAIDLKLHFMTRDLNIDPADGEVTLMGQTYDGVLVVGMDTVKVVPVK